MATDTTIVDEREPLLFNREATRPEAATEQLITPLPKVQIAVLLLISLAEPMTSQVIYPFINQLVGELDITGGDPKKVGYYAGLIESIFFATQAMFVFSWGRLSDRVGRKPVLLTGLAGLASSMLLFGISRTFWALVVSRSLNGILNANIGVMKSMIGEITDSTNVAQAFAFLPLSWSTGATIGPFIGGTLARPHDRFPKSFKNKFWVNYPYFLPCFISAAFAGLVALVTALLLKETVKKTPKYTQSNAPRSPGELDDGPLSIKQLMNKRILYTVATYCCVAMTGICFLALQPLFYSTAIKLGGLGFSTATVGVSLTVYGITNGIVQIFFFARVVRRFGPRVVILMGQLVFIPAVALFPAMNQLARLYGNTSIPVWALLVIQIFIISVADMAFGSVFIYVTSSAPNKRSLGSVNGMAQTTVSVARAIGPVTATSLFAASLQNNWLGGNAVYLALLVIPLIGLSFANQLPRQAWVSQ